MIISHRKTAYYRVKIPALSSFAIDSTVTSSTMFESMVDSALEEQIEIINKRSLFTARACPSFR